MKSVKYKKQNEPKICIAHVICIGLHQVHAEYIIKKTVGALMENNKFVKKQIFGIHLIFNFFSLQLTSYLKNEIKRTVFHFMKFIFTKSKIDFTNSEIYLTCIVIKCEKYFTLKN